LVDTSVCRARLEPSSAVFVHDALDLPSSCLNFDLSNACLGFVNGMQLAGTMIDSGQIEYALIVDAEGSRLIQERT
ncbi:MAG: 3-oxoacyl-ACP synthase III, partial [Actinobacteria bacterium]|nr:3-oxoacyl-ACP synthase III [Actinomycetota bacterium]